MVSHGERRERLGTEHVPVARSQSLPARPRRLTSQQQAAGPLPPRTTILSSSSTAGVPAASGPHLDGSSAAEGGLWRSTAQLTMDAEKFVCKGLCLRYQQKCLCSPTRACAFTSVRQENDATWSESHVHGFRSLRNAASPVFKWPNTRSPRGNHVARSYKG